MAEVNIFPLTTTLTAAIVSTTRPVTFAVAATDSALGVSGATFSCLIYDAGTDANPVNAEALLITSGGGTLNWTGTTETGSTAHTHANGSTVIATVITPRSLGQPLSEHVTDTVTPDPHTMYMRKASFLSKGDLLVGTGPNTFTRIPAPATSGAPLISAPDSPYGMQWVGAAAGGNVTSASLSATAAISATPGGARLAAVAALTTTTAGTVGAGTTQIATLSADGLTTITFQSIGTYKNLRLTGMARSAANVTSEVLRLQANADGNQVYTTEGVTFSGAVATPTLVDTPSTFMSLADVPGKLSLVGIAVSINVAIPNPSSGSFAKGFISQSVSPTASGVALVLRAGIWRPLQATPLTSITLSLGTGPFSSGSTFTLWGEA
jgi:hypothetical protein